MGSPVKIMLKTKSQRASMPTDGITFFRSKKPLVDPTHIAASILCTCYYWVLWRSSNARGPLGARPRRLRRPRRPCTWVAPRGSFGPCCAAVWEARCGRGELLVERRRAGLFEPSKSTYRSARRTRCRTSSRHEETLKTCNMI